MNFAGLMLFAGVYFVAVATPGPGLAAIVARALARGMRGAPAFIAGFVAGDLTLFFLSAAGLAVLAQNFAFLFVAVRLLGAAYLLVMAWKLWRAPVAALQMQDDTSTESSLTLFLNSYALTLGNPKPILFFLSIMPLVVDLNRLDAAALAAMTLIIMLVITFVLSAASLAANAARQVFSSPLALRRINRATALTLAGVAVAVATR